MNNICLKDDIIYFLSPCGLGDTMFLAGFKEALEKKYEAKIHFIIKPNHKIVMDLYNINDYTLAKIDIEELFRKNNAENKIGKGRIFIAHPLFAQNKIFLDDFNAGKILFTDMYKKFLGVDCDFKKPYNYPSLTPYLEEKLKEKDINDLSKTVLFIPEAATCPLLPEDFWINKAKEYEVCGYNVILNTKNKEYCIDGIKYVDLTLEEILAISGSLHKIVSLRNGLCDILAFCSKNLEVYYPDLGLLNQFSIKANFPVKLKEEIVGIFKRKYEFRFLFFKINIIKIRGSKCFKAYFKKFIICSEGIQWRK